MNHGVSEISLSMLLNVPYIVINVVDPNHKIVRPANLVSLYLQDSVRVFPNGRLKYTISKITISKTYKVGN